MLFGGCGLLTDATGGGDSFLSDLFFIGCLASLVVAVLGLIPVRLPGWMYPEWHEERRWRRREQAEWEAKVHGLPAGPGSEPLRAADLRSLARATALSGLGRPRG